MTRTSSIPARLLTLAALCGLTLGMLATATPASAASPAFHATIRRTSHGIPHITADDYGGLGFGYGFAFAQDNICTAADFYVTVNAQRSKYFGPDKSWTFHGNGTVNNNLDSDFYYAWINKNHAVEKLLDQKPPQGPLPEVRELVKGYVAGYNRYLDSVGGADGVRDPRCKGKPWVRKIDEMDVYRRFYQLASLASAGVAINEMGGAQPPTPDTGGAPGTGAAADATGMPTPQQLATIDRMPRRFNESLGIGSNAIALGRDATASGRGVLLGNPHFPWVGGERFYQAQLTIPGEMDVAGASLMGVPLILIGHTKGVAWSHTVSTAYRFTPFELTLVPGSPTTYLVDGQPHEMTRTKLSVPVKQDDGSIGTATRTLYATQYGRMLTGVLGLPLFPWTPARGFAMRDANEQMRYLNHFFAIDHAQSVDDVKHVLKTYLGIPWVNTIAADRDGNAYYADISVVPNVPDSKAQTCDTEVGQATFAALGLPVLDGARSSCNWDTDPDAPAPGIFGPSHLPDLERSDYVTNSNDSYWLSNPNEPLTGYARIIGDEATARSLRTRLGLRIVADRLAGTDAYAGEPGTPVKTWNADLLHRAVFNDRQYAGELTRDDAVTMCRSFPGGMAPSSSGPVSVTQDGVNACDVLAGWDLHDNLDSKGAILFRRFWDHASGAVPSPWVNGFDANDPVNTPNTLNTNHPQVQAALGDAINDLVGAGIPLDAPLRDFQYDVRNGERIPIHGGPGVDGVFNAINVDWDPTAGYPDVPHGSSFVMSVGFTDGACPDEYTILTYSQSEDPTSPWFADQTKMFSKKQWNRVPFCAKDVAADPNLTVTTVSSAAATALPPAGDGEVAAAPASGDLPATGGGTATATVGLLALGLAGWTRRRRGARM